MPYDLNKYRHTYQNEIDRWARRLGTEDRVALANKLVQACDCPCVVAGHLVGERFGFDDKLNQWLEILRQFSTTNEVVNKATNQGVPSDS